MSISRIQAIETGNDVPKVDIDSTKNNIPKYPVDLIGGSSPIDLQSITITENGTTEAPEGVAYSEVVVDVDTPTLTSITITENGTVTAPENVAYNEIITNVPSVTPTEVLESEFDLLHSNSTVGFYDSVKNSYLSTTYYRNFGNGYITDRDSVVLMNVTNIGDVKRVVVKTGEFNRSIEPNEEWLNLMRLNRDDWHFNLTYNTRGDYWRVSDQSGSEIDIPASTLPKYSFENTTFEIVYGAKYINGELYRGIKTNGVVTENYSDRIYVYLDDILVMENQYQSIYPDIRVGGGNGWIGAKFENVKIYDVLNVYDKFYEANTRKIKME